MFYVHYKRTHERNHKLHWTRFGSKWKQIHRQTADRAYMLLSDWPSFFPSHHAVKEQLTSSHYVCSCNQYFATTGNYWRDILVQPGICLFPREPVPSYIRCGLHDWIACQRWLIYIIIDWHTSSNPLHIDINYSHLTTEKYLSRYLPRVSWVIWYICIYGMSNKLRNPVRSFILFPSSRMIINTKYGEDQRITSNILNVAYNHDNKHISNSSTHGVSEIKWTASSDSAWWAEYK